MRQTITGGSQQLQVRVQDLERQNKALGSKVTDLQRRLERLETTAHPLNVRLVRAHAATQVA
jgi:chaperonin cofactor prefoldin